MRKAWWTDQQPWLWRFAGHPLVSGAILLAGMTGGAPGARAQQAPGAQPAREVETAGKAQYDQGVQSFRARLELNHLEKLADKADEVVDVTLDGPTLALAAKFIDMDKSNDPDDVEAHKFVKSLKGIYVKSFEFEKNGQYSDADVEEIRKQLQNPRWQKIVDVHSKKDHENDEIYTVTEGGKTVGLAIIAAEPRELTVVNLVGFIDVDKLSDLEGRFGVPKLGTETKSKLAKPEKEGAHDPAK